MKTQSKKRLMALLLTPLLVMLVVMVAPATSMAATLPVNLGTAANFAILASSTITCTGPTTINGDVGVYPGTAFIRGVPPAIVHGTIHLGDAVAHQAKLDLQAAYTDAGGRAAVTVGTELGGTTLPSGVYKSASGTFGITGTLTLDAQNDPNAVFIFQAGSTLVTATSSNVNLINGAKASQIFWQVGSSATLGTTSNFAGDILASASITANTGAMVKIRLSASSGMTDSFPRSLNTSASGWNRSCPEAPHSTFMRRRSPAVPGAA